MAQASIRIDIPYARDAVFLRAELISFDPLHMIRSGKAADVPAAIQEIEKLAGEKISSAPVLVCPHDDRHDVAWVIKEEADKRGWGFSRHVTGLLQIPADRECAYEAFETGSAEDSLPQRDAQVLIMQLGEQGREYFGSGMDFLPAMSVMRHSLWLALRHFGWQSPGTALTLRNLGYVMRATGNQDNIDEFIYLMRRLRFVWTAKPPVREHWTGSEVIVDQLRELLEAVGEPAGTFALPQA